MDQIYPDNGLLELLKSGARSIGGTGRYWAIFVNNVTPGLGDTIATYTQAGAVSTGPLLVPYTSFTITSVAAHLGAIQAPPLTFTNTSAGALTAYGYFVMDDTQTFLTAVARFDIPKPYGNGVSIPVTPIWATLSQLAS